MCLETHLVVELGESRMLWAFMGQRQGKPLNILQCRALASNSRSKWQYYIDPGKSSLE